MGNNAGYRIRARLEDLPRDEWDAMVRTNLTGVFLFTQAVGRVIIRRRAGETVSVSGGPRLANREDETAR